MMNQYHLNYTTHFDAHQFYGMTCLERELVVMRSILKLVDGDVRKAATKLGISVTQFTEKMKLLLS